MLEVDKRLISGDRLCLSAIADLVGCIPYFNS